MVKFKKKKKIILSIGEQGIVVSLIENKVIIKKVFAKSIEMANNLVKPIILEDLDASLYVLLDTGDQVYTKQVLPAVSSLAINNLIQKKFQRDFAESDIKGARLLGRKSVGRKDWVYLFASATMSSLILEWLDYVINLDCNFMGIYMLPLEVENVVKKVNQFTYKNKNDIPKWQFFISGNKVSGFRQVVFCEEKVIFTRLIPSNEEDVVDVVAGNIEQEVINTIDYLRRLDFADEDTLDITAVVPRDIKFSLESSLIQGRKIKLFTPYELSVEIGFQDISKPEDRFSDLIISAIFADSKPILKMKSLRTSRLNKSLILNMLANWLLATLVPVLLCFAGYLAFNVNTIKLEIDSIEQQKTLIENKWKNINKSSNYNIKDSEKITAVVTVHNKISKNLENPLDWIQRSRKFLVDNAYINSFNWRTIQDEKKPFDTSNIALVYNLSFYNTGKTIEELFSNFNAFISSIKEEFKEMVVENSKLPERISFGQKLNMIPIQIVIKSGTKKRY